jgi:hypothetical protein
MSRNRMPDLRSWKHATGTAGKPSAVSPVVHRGGTAGRAEPRKSDLALNSGKKPLRRPVVALPSGYAKLLENLNEDPRPGGIRDGNLRHEDGRAW